MKHTAVEFLKEKIKKYPELYFAMHLWFEDALEMEKQQIINAWFDRVANWDSEKEVEDYINETYKK